MSIETGQGAVTPDGDRAGRFLGKHEYPGAPFQGLSKDELAAVPPDGAYGVGAAIVAFTMPELRASGAE